MHHCEGRRLYMQPDAALGTTSAFFGLGCGALLFWLRILPTIPCLHSDCASGVPSRVALFQLGKLLQSTQSEA